MSADSNFDKLQEMVELFIENARHISIIASDFQPDGQATLNQKLHTLVNGLQELNRMKVQFSDVVIPQELLGYIDEGKNPQLYTRQCLEDTMKQNCEQNGKIELFKKFRASLMNELIVENFNDEVTAYRSLREANNESQ